MKVFMVGKAPVEIDVEPVTTVICLFIIFSLKLLVKLLKQNVESR